MLTERPATGRPPALTYAEWTRFLEDECMHRYGRTVADLPALDLAELWRSNIRPVTVARLGFAAVAAEEARRVREDCDVGTT